MKKLALTIIIGVAGVALSAEEFTIQTISAKKENSITPAFEKKVEKSALGSVKKKEGSCSVVTVGRYDSVKKARADLAKAKKIAKDAFVRPVARTVPKACEVVVAETKGKTAPKAEAQGIKAQTNVTAVKEAVAEQPKEVAAVVEQPQKREPSVRPTVILYDRNLARKSDIHDAIEYYKTSPYHSFKAVAMQQR